MIDSFLSLLEQVGAATRSSDTTQGAVIVGGAAATLAKLGWNWWRAKPAKATSPMVINASHNSTVHIGDK